MQHELPGHCAAVKKYTKYGVSEYGHVHTGPDFDADGIRVSSSSSDKVLWGCTAVARSCWHTSASPLF